MITKLKCVDCVKPTVIRTYLFEGEMYEWMLCEKCKDKTAFQNYHSERQCV
jgi:hypothetical protein